MSELYQLIFFISCIYLYYIVSAEEEVLYGLCGTDPDDTFTYGDDAENPFCFKFKHAYTGEDNDWLLFYYFGTRVDEYTYVALHGCMCALYMYYNNHIEVTKYI